ncbi:MAG: diphthine synthase [Candidatus Diapherotrites archaeon]|nr:diphthine synthase [Candidatus Diapherotrites archaeon]
MLYLIGAGLKPEQISVEGLKAVAECERVFLENYTSSYAEGGIPELEKILEKKVFPVGRKQVEEELKQILLISKQNNIALLIVGNVFSATTHFQIFLDAKSLGIKVKVIPGISVFSYLGKTGLQEYKFGRIVSIPRWEENFKPTSFYDYIKTNYNLGMHTLCLLDIKKEENYFMPITHALAQIKEIAKQKNDNFLSEAKLVALCSLGASDEIIFSGTAEEFEKQEFNSFPQSLIICAKPSDKELEGLQLYSQKEKKK